MKYIGYRVWTSILGMSLFLLTACTSVEPKSDEPLQTYTGTIVGEKCTVYAIQLDQKGALNAQMWQKKVLNTSTNQVDRTDYENVIGLIGLPKEYTQIGTRVKVALREASQQEASVDCYTDLPGPPQPRFIILNITVL